MLLRRAIVAICGCIALASWIYAAQTMVTASFGIDLRARSCEPRAVLSFVLLTIGSAAATVSALIARDLHRPGYLRVHFGTSAALSALPIATLILTLPGALGCSRGTSLARLDVIGDAISGSGGLVMASAACTLLGAAIGICVSIESPALAVRSDSDEGTEDPLEVMLDRIDEIGHDPDR